VSASPGIHDIFRRDTWTGLEDCLYRSNTLDSVDSVNLCLWHSDKSPALHHVDKAAQQQLAV
jgi:hypothetical protein